MSCFLNGSSKNTDIMVLNNFEVDSQIKSSIFQSKLQQSIQNLRQLTKPIALHVETAIQPLHKPEIQTPVKKSHKTQLSSDNFVTITKEQQKQIIQQQEFSQNSVQNYYEYQYRISKNELDKETPYVQIFEQFHKETLVRTLTTYEDCFKILSQPNGYQLVAIPTNIILEILRKREQLQRETLQQRRKLEIYERQEKLQKKID